MTKSIDKNDNSFYVDNSIDGFINSIDRISENCERGNSQSAILCLMQDQQNNLDIPDKMHCIYKGNGSDIIMMLYHFIMNSDFKICNLVWGAIEVAMKDRLLLDNEDLPTIH